MRTLPLVALACAALAASSCAGRGPKAVLGKWQTPSGNTIEFRPDGTATLTATHSREIQYNLPDTKTIAFSATVNGNHARWQWQILSLTRQEMVVSQDGKQTVFRRVH